MLALRGCSGVFHKLGWRYQSAFITLRTPPKTHCLHGVSTQWKRACSIREAVNTLIYVSQDDYQAQRHGVILLAYLVRVLLKGLPSVESVRHNAKGTNVLAGLMSWRGYSLDEHGFFKVKSSLSSTTRHVRGVAEMASSLRIGQVVKGLRDVYVVAQKLHDQVWSARSVPLSTQTSVICAR